MIDPERLRRELAAAPEGNLQAGSLVVRPSPRAAVSRTLVALAAVLAVLVPVLLGFYGVESRKEDVPPIVHLFERIENAGFLFAFVPALLPVVQIFFTRYVLDEEGIRERVQILSRTERRVPWEKVTALIQHRTIMDRLLGIQRLQVVAYGQRGTTLHLVGLREAAYLRLLIARRMRETASVAQLGRND